MPENNEKVERVTVEIGLGMADVDSDTFEADAIQLGNLLFQSRDWSQILPPGVTLERVQARLATPPSSEPVEPDPLEALADRMGNLNAKVAGLLALMREPEQFVDAERLAQMIAHRKCTNEEHDPDNGKVSAYCVTCGLLWPCLYAGPTPTAPQTPEGPNDQSE